MSSMSGNSGSSGSSGSSRSSRSGSRSSSSSSRRSVGPPSKRSRTHSNDDDGESKTTTHGASSTPSAPGPLLTALPSELQDFDSEMATYRNAQRAIPTIGMSAAMIADHEGQCLMARLMHDEIGRLQSTGKPCTVCGCDGTCMS